MKKQIVDLHFEDEASYDDEKWANFDDEVGDIHGVDVNANILPINLVQPITTLAFGSNTQANYVNVLLLALGQHAFGQQSLGLGQGVGLSGLGGQLNHLG